MKVVYKYILKTRGSQVINLPIGARILCLQVQETVGPCIWAEVDPDADKEQVAISTYGTGHPIIYPGTYIGTYQLGRVVGHVYKDDQ